MTLYPGQGTQPLQGTVKNIDGKLAASGTTWESYYPLAVPAEPVPDVATMLFRASGTAAPALQGQGFLIDNLTYASS